MKKIVFLLLFVLFAFSLVAQEVSTPKAVLFSAFIPGSGHLYIQKYSKAGIYFASEIGIIFSYFHFKSEKNWAKDSYKTYANAKINLPFSSDENKYQIVQNYYSSEDYNINKRMWARDNFLANNDPEAYYEFLKKYLIPEDESWHWQTKENWNKYKDWRYRKQDYEILTNFSIAAAILNRVISVIDVAVSSRRLNRTLNNLSIKPDLKNKGIKVAYEIKF